MGYIINPYTEPMNTAIYNPGVAWFLLQLILFDLVYIFACGEGWHPRVSCPSLLSFFFISILIGISTGITSIFLPSQNDAVGVPHFWRAYPSYVILFFSGALASRNEWMETIKNMSRFIIYVWAFTVYAILMVGLFLMPKYTFFQTLAGWCFGQFMIGIQCIPWILCTTVFFMDFVNNKYFCTVFFTKAMYTSYLIHSQVIILVALIWAKITDVAGFNSWSEGGWVATCLFITLVSLSISWPLAYGIVSIPGFSNVL